MVEYFQNKYSGESVARILGDGEDMSDEITQQGLLPGVKWVAVFITTIKGEGPVSRGLTRGMATLCKVSARSL